MPIILKTISLVLMAGFVFQELSYAGLEILKADRACLPAGRDSGEREKKENLHWAKELLPDIPGSVATIEDAWQAPVNRSPGRLVYLIQDAHANPSAQFNIAKTLDLIFSRSLLSALRSPSYVFLEGGYKDNSLSFLKKYSTPQRRKQAAESFVHQGKLQGVEYQNIVGDKDFTIWGVEELPLYSQSIAAYRAVAKDREKFENYLQKVESSINTLKSRIYNPLLLSWDKKYWEYQKPGASLTDYFKALKHQAQIFDLNLSKYPHLKALEDLKDFEQKIDFKKANGELQKAVASLSEKESHSLFKVSVQNHTADNGFFALLEEKLTDPSVPPNGGTPPLRKGRIDTEIFPLLTKEGQLPKATGRSGTMHYPNLFKYFDYLKKSKSLDFKVILEDQKKLEEDLFKKLCTNSDEENLLSASKNTATLKKLLALTLTPDEYETYKKEKESFGITRMTGFLNRKIMELRQYYENAVFLEEGYEDIVKHAEEFYELTYERDKKFVGNMLKKMESGERIAESEQQKTESNPAFRSPLSAILITGGYHTPNLKYLLKQQNISYISITPQITQETNQALYEKLLLNQTIDTKFNKLPFQITQSPLTHTANVPTVILQLMTGQPQAAARLAEEMSGTPEQETAIFKDFQRHASGTVPAFGGLSPERTVTEKEGARLAFRFTPSRTLLNSKGESFDEIWRSKRSMVDSYGLLYPSLWPVLDSEEEEIARRYQHMSAEELGAELRILITGEHPTIQTVPDLKTEPDDVNLLTKFLDYLSAESVLSRHIIAPNTYILGIRRAINENQDKAERQEYLEQLRVRLRGEYSHKSMVREVAARSTDPLNFDSEAGIIIKKDFNGLLGNAFEDLVYYFILSKFFLADRSPDTFKHDLVHAFRGWRAGMSAFVRNYLDSSRTKKNKEDQRRLIDKHQEFLTSINLLESYFNQASPRPELPLKDEYQKQHLLKNIVESVNTAAKVGAFSSEETQDMSELIHHLKAFGKLIEPFIAAARLAEKMSDTAEEKTMILEDFRLHASSLREGRKAAENNATPQYATPAARLAELEGEILASIRSIKTQDQFDALIREFARQVNSKEITVDDLILALAQVMADHQGGKVRYKTHRLDDFEDSVGSVVRTIAQRLSDEISDRVDYKWHQIILSRMRTVEIMGRVLKQGGIHSQPSQAIVALVEYIYSKTDGRIRIYIENTAKRKITEARFVGLLFGLSLDNGAEAKVIAAGDAPEEMLRGMAEIVKDLLADPWVLEYQLLTPYHRRVDQVLGGARLATETPIVSHVITAGEDVLESVSQALSQVRESQFKFRVTATSLSQFSDLKDLGFSSEHSVVEIGQTIRDYIVSHMNNIEIRDEGLTLQFSIDLPDWFGTKTRSVVLKVKNKETLPGRIRVIYEDYRFGRKPSDYAYGALRAAVLDRFGDNFILDPDTAVNVTFFIYDQQGKELLKSFVPFVDDRLKPELSSAGTPSNDGARLADVSPLTSLVDVSQKYRQRVQLTPGAELELFVAPLRELDGAKEGLLDKLFRSRLKGGTYVIIGAEDAPVFVAKVHLVDLNKQDWQQIEDQRIKGLFETYLEGMRQGRFDRILERLIGPGASLDLGMDPYTIRFIEYHLIRPTSRSGEELFKQFIDHFYKEPIVYAPVDEYGPEQILGYEFVATDNADEYQVKIHYAIQSAARLAVENQRNQIRQALRENFAKRPPLRKRKVQVSETYVDLIMLLFATGKSPIEIDKFADRVSRRAARGIRILGTTNHRNIDSLVISSIEVVARSGARLTSVGSAARLAERKITAVRTGSQQLFEFMLRVDRWKKEALSLDGALYQVTYQALPGNRTEQLGHIRATGSSDISGSILDQIIQALHLKPNGHTPVIEIKDKKVLRTALVSAIGQAQELTMSAASLADVRITDTEIEAPRALMLSFLLAARKTLKDLGTEDDRKDAKTIDVYAETKRIRAALPPRPRPHKLYRIRWGGAIRILWKMEFKIGELPDQSVVVTKASLSGRFTGDETAWSYLVSEVKAAISSEGARLAKNKQGWKISSAHKGLAGLTLALGGLRIRGQISSWLHAWLSWLYRLDLVSSIARHVVKKRFDPLKTP